MEKAKRYLGLFVAVCLLAIGFMSVPKDRFSHRDNSEKITLLDGTILSALVIYNDPRSFDKFNFWKISTDFFNTCASFQGANSTNQDAFVCESGWVFNYVGDFYKEQLSALDPSYPEMRKQYEVLRKADYELLYKVKQGLVVDRILLAKSQEPRYQLERKMGAAIAKFLSAEKPTLALTIYLLHAAWIGFCLLLIWQRAMLGSLICLPFGLLFGASAEVAKAAKKAHEKV